MANFNGYLLRSYPDNGGYAVHRSLHKAFTSDASAAYAQFKTNVPVASYIMTTIEAVGYSYGTAEPIRCAWGFYTYGTYIATSSLSTSEYTGLVPKSVYTSADGYVCIIGSTPGGYPGGLYYCGFVLNGYQTAGYGRGFALQITASSYGTTSDQAF